MRTKQILCPRLHSLSLGSLLVLSATSNAATLNLSGNATFGTHLFSNLDLASGATPGAGNTTNYVSHRLLLRPDVVVDDRFTIKSEVILFGSPEITDIGASTVRALDSSIAQNRGHQLATLRRTWLEWASDWGVFRIGRQPKAWGLGLIYNPGNDPFDPVGSTVDRASFQAMLGNLGLNLAYEKQAEGALNNDGDDAETYSLSLDYSNPESLFDVGILYDRRVVSAAGRPIVGGNSAHILSIFAKKRFGKFQAGGEFSTINEAGDRGHANGLLAQIDYQPSAWKLSADFAFASGGSTNSFVINRSYRPFMMLYNMSVGGRNATNPGPLSPGVGAAIGSGAANGALLTKVGAAYEFTSSKLTLGTDLGFATFAKKNGQSSSYLGTEWDLHLTQQWYDNFRMVYGTGFLFPGKAFGPNPQVAWGLQIQGALSF